MGPSLRRLPNASCRLYAGDGEVVAFASNSSRPQVWSVFRISGPAIAGGRYARDRGRRWAGATVLISGVIIWTSASAGAETEYQGVDSCCYRPTEAKQFVSCARGCAQSVGDSQRELVRMGKLAFGPRNADRCFRLYYPRHVFNPFATSYWIIRSHLQ
jgi:hypothetical protein